MEPSSILADFLRFRWPLLLVHFKNMIKTEMVVYNKPKNILSLEDLLVADQKVTFPAAQGISVHVSKQPESSILGKIYRKGLKDWTGDKGNLFIPNNIMGFQERVTSREVTLVAGEFICSAIKMVHCGSENPKTGKINRESFIYLAMIEDIKFANLQAIVYSKFIDPRIKKRLNKFYIMSYETGLHSYNLEYGAQATVDMLAKNGIVQPPSIECMNVHFWDKYQSEITALKFDNVRKLLAYFIMAFLISTAVFIGENVLSMVKRKVDKKVFRPRRKILL